MPASPVANTRCLLKRLGRAFSRRLFDLDGFVRLHFLAFSCIHPLLGAASVAPELGGMRLLGLLAVTVCFHNYAFVFNDVIDLPVDRAQPLRSADPLVRGAIRPWQALAFALLHVPLALVLTAWLDAGPLAWGSLAAAFALMAVYDLWGKRCPVPSLTDAAQGAAWGSLALYGAAVAGGELNRLSLLAFAYGFGFIFLVNGIHGGLRDLRSDLAGGRRTAAIFLGARPLGEGRTQVPRALRVFAHAVHAALLALVILPLLRNDFGYVPGALAATLAAALAMSAWNLWLMHRLLDREERRAQRALRIHVYALLFTLVLPFVPLAGFTIRTLLLGGFFLSLLTAEWTYTLIGLLFRGDWRRAAVARHNGDPGESTSLDRMADRS